MAQTRAQKTRAIRQEALREQLAAKGLETQALEDIKKINELANIDLKDFDSAEDYIANLSTAKDKAQIIKMALDGRLKLLAKYLPDLKQQELVGEGGGPIETSTPVLFVDAEED